MNARLSRKRITRSSRDDERVITELLDQFKIRLALDSARRTE